MQITSSNVDDTQASLASDGVRLYLVWSVDDTNSASDDIAFTRSLDAGLTWETHIVISVFGRDSILYHENEAHVATFGDTGVVVCWKIGTEVSWGSYTNMDILVRTSRDRGVSWNSEIRVGGGIADPDTQSEGLCTAVGDPMSQRAMVRPRHTHVDVLMRR